jgi:hypothetical protein
MLKITSKIILTSLVFALSSCATNAPITLPESGATLEGTVTYGGEPVLFALIIAQNNNGSATGKVDPQTGKYLIKNIPLGEVNIAVNTDAGMGDYQQAVMQGGAYKGPDGKAGTVNLKLVAVPKKYHDVSSSGLTTTIVKGSNTFNIQIDK